MYPDWVLKHKIKGTNISQIKGKYYLYAVSSKWDKEKGRAQKITNEYLGRITEEGLILPKSKSGQIETPVTVKEYGASSVLCLMGADILEKLREVFPVHGDQIITMAALRVIEPSPFKRLEHYYNMSYLSETFKCLNLSAGSISVFLKDFGGNREKIVEFMKGFIGGSEHMIFDGTSILSKSENMEINRAGYNVSREYDPQINLLYAFACGIKQPVYYRLIPGNVRDVSAFKLSVTEAELENVVVVADKGFGSEDNFKMLEGASIKYIVPLKRNAACFDTAKLETGNKASFDGYFMFNQRPIWYYKLSDTVVFLDADLKNREEKQYLNNIEKNKDGYTMEGFIERQYKFGTMILKHNTSKTPQEIYSLYKERGEIEQSFDFLKNLLEQDKSYMQDAKSLETWAFINHVSLLLNYKIYNLLREKKLLAIFSVADFIAHLKYIFKVKINGDWHISEVTKKTKHFLDSIGFHIT